ncbi:hypothetical protein FB192DRAFT_1377310 [Mucor lusitanicus]|uniref:Uncharacterized protein n=1 Tax=Mucor circinelloides f. lusitanicus TaxID=29924 RepID=A0A8H4BH94_MUCCL|nr:hypothetical protein FB192DRAFT_1377310 [Mucor lusitanicus]
MVYLSMHCIAGSAALLWSSLAFFLFFKYYFFCSTGGIGVFASYDATTLILFSTTFVFLCSSF